MHILITADTVGGVWTYTQELVRGLLSRGHRITLVSFGAYPSPDQILWMNGLSSLHYWPTNFRLEWMQDAERDIEESSAYLERIIAQVRPDVLHFSQYCYGSIVSDLPRVVVAHSDVVSWWVGVHGHEPQDSPWINWYRRTVARGLSGADMVVGPSHWMLDAIRSYHFRPKVSRVIYNGRSPHLFHPDLRKENYVLAVGRVWDAAKQVSLLLEYEHSVPVCIVGSDEEPGKAQFERENLGYSGQKLQFRGPRTQQQIAMLFGEASMYAACSCYEPFGLAALEAAFSRCALIANDIPVFHELWGDAACYFCTNDSSDLARGISELGSDALRRDRYADMALGIARSRFTAERMVDEYEGLYQWLRKPASSGEAAA